ncbi:MAG: 30S ribosomal protein S18 [bacterium]|nr:30S ribosomal protein S18 [bacterium]
MKPKRQKKRPRPAKFKQCPFCKDKKEPYFMKVDFLKEFISLQGKILPKSASGVCAKHQRRLSVEIKRARILALLPFTQPKVVRG